MGPEWLEEFVLNLRKSFDDAALWPWDHLSLPKVTMEIMNATVLIY